MHAVLKRHWLAALCAALAAGTWWLAATDLSLYARWSPQWPWGLALGVGVYAWIAGLSTYPDEAPHRRIDILVAIGLVISLVLAEPLCAWATGAAPSLWRAVFAALNEGTTPWWVSLLTGASLLSLWRHLRIPQSLHWLSLWSAIVCLMPWPLMVGAWARPLLPSLGLWVIPLVGGALCMRGQGLYLGLVTVLVSLSVLLHAGIQALSPAWASTPAYWLLQGMALASPVWAVWVVRMNAIREWDKLEEALRADPDGDVAVDSATVPPFDLTAHLDSPRAQEGADKYTRE